MKVKLSICIHSKHSPIHFYIKGIVKYGIMQENHGFDEARSKRQMLYAWSCFLCFDGINILLLKINGFKLKEEMKVKESGSGSG